MIHYDTLCTKKYLLIVDYHILAKVASQLVMLIYLASIIVEFIHSDSLPRLSLHAENTCAILT